MRQSVTYHALLAQGDHTILHPEPPASHQIGHHYVRSKPVPNNRDVRGTRHAGLGVIPKVLHDLGSTAWLLLAVWQYVDARCLRYRFRLFSALVKSRTGRI